MIYFLTDFVFCCLIVFLLGLFSVFKKKNCILVPFSIKTVTNFIMKAFINGRTLFGTPVKVFPPVYPSQMVSNCCLKITLAYFGDIIQALTL